jgi:hypothetical protein
MMKDRIQNPLAVGDKVVVALPEAQIFGYVAQLDEGGVISGVRGVRGGVEQRPGRVLVSAIIAIPVDAYSGVAIQVVKVYDTERQIASPAQAEAREAQESMEN